MMGDPHQIRALSARLRADADQLHRLAARVGRTSDLAWRSRAASVFRERVVERAHALRRSAEELDDAARRVDAHADGVEVAREEVARVARLGADLARSARHAVTRTVGP